MYLPWILRRGIATAFFVGLVALTAVGQEVRLEIIDLVFKKERQPANNDMGRPEIKEYEEEWWSAQITFETEGGMLKEMTVKFYIECYDSLSASPEEEACTLVAEQTFINIPEGKHFATVYLHPGAAMRYGGSKGARDFSRNSVHVEVTADGIDEVTRDLERESKGEWYKEGKTVEGVLLPAEKSPWWPYVSKQYNQIKAAK